MSKYSASTLLLCALISAIPGRAVSDPPPGWHQDIPTGPSSIDGVPVSGHLDAVSVADVLQAITAFKDIGLQLSEVTVLSKDEIHAYGANRDLGWFTAQRMICMWSDRSQHPCWDAFGQGLPQFKAALECIKAAQQVYVFPVATPLDPRRDDSHMRLIGGDASSQLIALLAPADNWLRGLNDLMYPDKEKKSVGFVFRDGTNEVVLFAVHSDVLIGTYNGEHFGGTLDLESENVEKEFKEWIAKYAKPELGQQ